MTKFEIFLIHLSFFSLLSFAPCSHFENFKNGSRIMEWKYPLPKINSSCSSFLVHFNFFVPSTFKSSIIINCYIHDIMWNIRLVSTQKFFEKLKKIRNVSPSENAAYVLNDWIKPNTDYNLYYTDISWHKSRRSKSISSLYYQFVGSTFCVGRIFCGVIMIQHKHTIKCRTRLFNYERRKKVYGIRLRIQVIYIIHNQLSFHCVKSVLIRSFSGPYFSAFGLKTTR